MSYYLETARPAMREAAEVMGEQAEAYTHQVEETTAAMGRFDWPLMMFFCKDAYNQSLLLTRDAAKDIGEGVSAVAATLDQIRRLYEKLEEIQMVK